MSIFSPVQPWIILIGIKLMLLFLTIQSVKSNYFKKTFVLILLGGLMTLCLTLFSPYILGYIGWEGDHQTQIGYVKDIITCYRIPNEQYIKYGARENFYPISHIYATFIIIISNLPKIKTIISIVPTLSIFLIPLGSIIFTKTFLKSDKITYIPFLIVLTSTIVPNDYEIYFRPNALAYLLLPLIIYSILKIRNHNKFALISILLLMELPFLHPHTSLVILIGLIGTNIIYLAYYRVNLKTSHFIITMLSVIGFIAWMFSFGERFSSAAIRKIFLLENRYSSGIESVWSMAIRVNFTFFDVVKMALKVYGEEVFITFLTLVFLVRVIKKPSERDILELRSFFGVMTFVLVSLFTYLGYLLLPSAVFGEIFGERSNRYFILLILGMASAVLAWTYNINISIGRFRKLKKMLRIIIFSILVIIIVNNTFATYKSPYTLYPNIGLTNKEIQEYQWAFKTLPSNVHYVKMISDPRRYYEMISGRVTTYKKSPSSWAPQIPDHFGYTQKMECDSQNDYLIIPLRDRVAYLIVWKIAKRFTVGDFLRLNSSPCSSKIYNSGGYEVWIL